MINSLSTMSSLHRIEIIWPILLVICLGISCTRKDDQVSSAKEQKTRPTVADFAAAGYREAPIAKITPKTVGGGLEITLTGFLSNDCNALALADREGLAMNLPEYELKNNEIHVHVWQYKSDDESCIVTAPQWEKVIKIPDLGWGGYRIVANNTPPLIVDYQHRETKK